MMERVREVIAECWRGEHERCPTWLHTMHPTPPAEIVCSCDCHVKRTPEEWRRIREVGRG